MLAGKVEKDDFATLINFLMVREEEGILFLENSKFDCELHFRMGDIVGYIVGTEIGENEIEKIINMRTPNFRFERTSILKDNLEAKSKVQLDLFVVTSKTNGISFNKFTIIIPNPRKRPRTDLLDAKKWSLLNIISSGELFGRIQKYFTGSTSELITNLNELLREDVVSIIPTEPSKNLFLFPKPVRIGLNQEETQIFWHIIDGISIYELITKIEMSLEKLISIIVKIILKKKMVLTNSSGQILEPWHIYDSLGLVVSAKPVKLSINHNGRITSRSGVVTVDILLYEIWKQQLMGKDFSSIVFFDGIERHSIFVQTRNSIKNEIHFSPFDIKKMNLEVGKIVECEPEIES
jgi:hypothetical protein